MKPEIEVKFLNVSHDELRAKLKELGAEQAAPLRLMKRKNYDFEDGRLDKVRSWVRLRDEAGKITLAYKQLHDRTLDGTHEVSLTVDNFENADALLAAIGLKARSYHETKRESWRLNEFEIELDEWPWVKPYVEIEGSDEAGLKSLAQKLGLDWGRVCYGSVEVVYRGEYDVTDEEFCAISVVTFEEPVPAWLEERRLK